MYILIYLTSDATNIFQLDQEALLLSVGKELNHLKVYEVYLNVSEATNIFQTKQDSLMLFIETQEKELKHLKVRKVFFNVSEDIFLIKQQELMLSLDQKQTKGEEIVKVSRVNMYVSKDTNMQCIGIFQSAS